MFRPLTVEELTYYFKVDEWVGKPIPVINVINEQVGVVCTPSDEPLVAVIAIILDKKVYPREIFGVTADFSSAFEVAVDFAHDICKLLSEGDIQGALSLLDLTEDNFSLILD